MVDYLPPCPDDSVTYVPQECDLGGGGIYEHALPEKDTFEALLETRESTKRSRSEGGEGENEQPCFYPPTYGVELVDQENEPNQKSPCAGACFNCGNLGHFSKECPLLPPAKRRKCDENKCFTCGQYGHIARDCPADNQLSKDCRGVCFDFREKSHCRFGDQCKYSHELHKWSNGDSTTSTPVQSRATTLRHDSTSAPPLAMGTNRLPLIAPAQYTPFMPHPHKAVLDPSVLHHGLNSQHNGGIFLRALNLPAASGTRPSNNSITGSDRALLHPSTILHAAHHRLFSPSFPFYANPMQSPLGIHTQGMLMQHPHCGAATAPLGSYASMIRGQELMMSGHGHNGSGGDAHGDHTFGGPYLQKGYPPGTMTAGAPHQPHPSPIHMPVGGYPGLSPSLHDLSLFYLQARSLLSHVQGNTTSVEGTSSTGAAQCSGVEEGGGGSTTPIGVISPENQPPASNELTVNSGLLPDIPDAAGMGYADNSATSHSNVAGHPIGTASGTAAGSSSPASHVHDNQSLNNGTASAARHTQHVTSRGEVPGTMASAPVNGLAPISAPAMMFHPTATLLAQQQALAHALQHYNQLFGMYLL